MRFGTLTIDFRGRQLLSPCGNDKGAVIRAMKIPLIFLGVILMAINSSFGFYNPKVGRWTTRDPKEEKADANLYLFNKNAPIYNVDPLGLDIYLYTGNNSGKPLNDALHQTIAVDTWSDDCPPRKTGIRGFSFGYDGEWGWNWSNGLWLGHPSITLPGYFMVGVIYEAPVVGKVVDKKTTTPKQDKAWLKKMEDRVGTRDVYSVGRHNCRNFSQSEFNNAPGKK